MIDGILQATELPNLHPALVHFPIALLPLAAGFDAVVLALRLRGRPGPEGATLTLYALAVASAWAALWAGEVAEESLSALPAVVETAVEAHEEWASRFVYTATAVALARLAVAWWGRSGRPGRRAALLARGAILLLALVAVGLLVEAADRGGGLVYRAGVGVMAVPSPGTEPPAP
ncbi:MAG: DUF2231 domain-containing protein [Thermoanaerobaculia bacterium]